MTGPGGMPVNAFYGYAGFLLDVIDEEKPTNMAVAFDESLTSSYRNEIFPAYKANRELPPPEAFFSKPFDRDAFIKRVGEILDG